ncbi:unnamed protein product [Paramecium pentaurelia]|uniref:Uncharacterized protein n=1 Tax=Paramecium pentaurelia TaxID=43138 RepID=A0A8S1XQE7_9CILI|nr:unnamed protein product [Paramecium pentaurelia]
MINLIGEQSQERLYLLNIFRKLLKILIKIGLIDLTQMNQNNNQTNKTYQNDNYNYLVPEVVKCDSNFDKTADIWKDFIQGFKNPQEQRHQLCKLTQEWINKYIIKTKDLIQFEQNFIKSILQIKNTEGIRLENLLKEIN